MRLQPVYRITVFVPPADLAALQAGICAVDPLQAGRYDRAMWVSAPGEEQFRPLPGAQPALGAIGELVRTPTVRLEFAIARDRQLLERIVEHGIRPYHPWEVPAIFVDEALLPLPER